MYKNLELAAGVSESFTFIVEDETGLPVNLTGYTSRFELTSETGLTILVKTPTATSAEGKLVVTLTGLESSAFMDARYSYRLVTTLGSVNDIAFEGSLTVQGPTSGTPPAGSLITLSDGTVYATTAVAITPGTWYAIATFFRIAVSGTGWLSIDGRDLRGDITGNVATFMAGMGSNVAWYPDLTGYTAFRINVLSGAPTATYLP